MNLCGLVRVDKVVRAHQSAVRNDSRRLVLLFAQPCSPVAVHVVIVVGSNLNEIERNLAQAELLAPLLHEQRHSLGILVAGIAHVRAALIVENAFHRVLQDGVERAVAPQHGAVVVPFGLEGNDAGRVCRLLRVFLQVLLGQPALHARPAFVCHDESHRHVQRLVHHLCEEIARRRGLAHRLRAHFLPVAVGIFLRLHAHDARYLHVVHAPVGVRVHHFFVISLNRTVAETLHRHLHVALSGAYPHFASEHVVQRQLVAVVEGDG